MVYYILYSEAFDKYYIGYTNDYRRRLSEHNESIRNTYTSKYRPWKIKAIFECAGEEANAVNIERFIKRQKSSVFLEKLIESNELTGILAQLVRVPKFRD